MRPGASPQRYTETENWKGVTAVVQKEKGKKKVVKIEIKVKTGLNLPSANSAQSLIVSLLSKYLPPSK